LRKKETGPPCSNDKKENSRACDGLINRSYSKKNADLGKKADRQPSKNGWVKEAIGIGKFDVEKKNRERKTGQDAHEVTGISESPSWSAKPFSGSARKT